MPWFDDIVGEEQLKSKMKAISQSGPSHAYLLAGERRSGKTTLAKCFAAALQCEGEGEKPCGRCMSCLQVEEGSHPDVVWLSHDKEETIGVEDIRTGVNEDILLKPYRGKYKVYLIDDAQKMTVQAQNALLKTLEEPPSYGVIILISNTVEAMLPTIQSRSVLLPVKPLPDEVIRGYLMNRMRVPDYRADVITAFARGNLGRACDLIANEEFEELKSAAISTLKGITDADLGKTYTDAAEIARKYKESKSSFAQMMDFFLFWYRDALVYKSTGRSEGLIFREEIQYIKKVSGEMSYEGFEDVFRAIKEAKEKLRFNVNAETVADLLLISLKDSIKK
jgi:DNA polymerase-3 subunit delta'